MLCRRFISSDSFSGKSVLLTFILFCFSQYSFSQGTTPQQQAKIDSLMAYINLQILEGKIPDQKYIDSTNAVIRSMNINVAVSDSATHSAIDSVHEITKQSMSGSSFTVPEGKVWRVKKLYVNDGGSYNVLVTSVKFDQPLKAGDKLFTPAWTAEGELLNGDQSGFSYIFKIEETDKAN